LTTEKDLVWLVWNGFNRYPTLKEELPGGVTIDMASESWTFREQTIKFGRAVLNPFDCPHGEESTPLGAYDRTNVEHLKMMLVDYYRFSPALTTSIHPS